MSRKMIVLICLAICISVVSFSAYGDNNPNNLLSNSDFETVDAGKFPGWISENGGDTQSVFTVGDNKFRSGKYSLMIRSDAPNDARMYQTVNVKPDTFYRFSGWIATENVPVEQNGANLSIMGVWDRSNPITGTATWTYGELNFKTHAKQTQIILAARLGMWGSLNTGTAYFDDLSLEEVSSQPASYATMVDPGAQSSSSSSSAGNPMKSGLGPWGLIIFAGFILILLNILFNYLQKRAIERSNEPANERVQIPEENETESGSLWVRFYRCFIKEPEDSPQVEPVKENSLWQKLAHIKIGRFSFDSRYILLVLILIIGSFVRLYNLENNPPGLNQDEASVAYDAYALANYGIDRNGMHFPIHFISWGSGQNSLYAYVIMPFIKIFGLNATTTRIGSALFGIIGLLLLFLALKFLANWEISLLSTFIYAISPWGIISARSGVENNIFPVIVLLGVYLYLLALKKRRYLTWSFIVLALSLYSYGTSYFVIPLFLLGLAICFYFYDTHSRTHKLEYLHSITKDLMVFGIVALPLAIFLMINFSPIFTSSIQLPFLSIPKLTTPGARFGQVIFLNQGVGLSDMINKAIQNYSYYWETVFKQMGSIFFVADRYGEIYLLSNIFFLIGFAIALVELWRALKKKKLTLETIFIIWFLLSSILGIIFEINPGRINIIFFPMIFFVAYGIFKLAHGVAAFTAQFFKAKQHLVRVGVNTLIYVIIVALYLNLFFGFHNFYTRFYPDQVGMYSEESFEDALAYATSIQAPHQKMCICPTDYTMGYIYVLFYQKYDPHKFIETVKYHDPNADFRVVLSFGDYNFIDIPDNFQPEKDVIYLIGNDKTGRLPSNAKVFRQFKRFTVEVF